MRLLVIEDDVTLRETLCSPLAEAGFGVEQAADGREGLYFALEYPIDLAIVDLGLPEISGLDLIRELREKGKTYPILILTARDRWQDKVDGLSAGADDYVVKPFSMRELTLRIQAVSSRSSGLTPGLRDEGGKVRIGDARIDFAAYTGVAHAQRTGLSRRELDLLRYFLAHEGEVLERGRLLDDVWGQGEFPTARTIDTHVLKLRKKIEAKPEAPRHILTVHGVGYRFSRQGED